MAQGYSIFGHSESKFIFEGTDVFLTHSVIEPNWQIPDYEVNQGLFTGNKDFKTQGYYSEFTVKINLHKNADAIGVFEDIYQYNHKEVQFFPHYDGEPIKTEDGTATQSFHITNMDLSYVDKFGVYDVLDITFKTAGRSSYTFTAPPTGSGSEPDPYLIYDSDDMNRVRLFLDSYWMVVNNFDMSDYPNWDPIIDFEGSFDGNNRVITGLTIHNSSSIDQFTGLFGDTGTNMIAMKDLTIDGASIILDTEDGWFGAENFVGVLAAFVRIGTTISNIKIKNSSILCAPTEPVLNPFRTDMGGLIGACFGDVESCSIENSTVTFVQDYVNSSNGNLIGGLIGNLQGTAELSYVEGCTITCDRGGIAGDLGAGFSHNNNINGTNNCYVANVTMSGHGATSDDISGFVTKTGTNKSVNCYSNATAINSDLSDMYPFYNEVQSGVKTSVNCYYDSGSWPGTAQSSGVTGSISADMKISSSYIGWDFENIWAIDESEIINNGYPYLIGNAPS